MIPRLKSIELQGYKTFANKTEFQFPSPITAIVGPNGSGKSNIADSIRWVLGEQSFSLLRGKKTIDMIFSGSEFKARSSMASATIVFDNNGQWLPIDFDEVSITRRAFRDGQNEYLVNGQKVRLKDVSELLAQSGLSERTYSIMGQGLIDNALSLKPDERRKFFEEAAGIGLFRSRRDEALQRLEDTKHNMERIADIIGELEPRVHSLEKQAERASEYEIVQNDLRMLLKEWYGYYWYKSQSVLQVAIERRNEQEKLTNQIHSDYEKLGKICENLQQQAKDIRLEIGNLHNNLSETHQSINQFTQQMAVIDEKISSAKTQSDNYMEEMNSAADELKLAEEKKKSLQAESDELKNSQIEMLEKKKNSEVELQSQLQKIRELREILSGKRALQNEIENKLFRQREKCEELENQSGLLDTTIKSQQMNIEKGLVSAKVINSDFNRIKDLNDENQRRLNEIKIKQNDSKKILDLSSQERKKFTEEKNNLETELSKLNAKLEVLKNADLNLIGFGRGTQFLMKNARLKKAESNFRLLESQIIVPEDLEPAVAGALGNVLEGLVVNGSDQNIVIDLLQSGDNGRAVIISQNFSSMSNLVPENPKLSGLQSISSLIKSSPSVKNVIDQILGNVYLVEDRTQAQILQKDLSSGQSIVTKDGSVYRWDGVIISGKENGHQVLTRTREIRELSMAEEKLKADSINCSRQISEIDEKIKENQKKYDDASADYDKAAQNMLQIQKRLNQITLQRDQQNQITIFQQQKLKESQNQKEETVRKLDSQKKEIELISAQRKEAQDAVHTAMNNLNQIQLGDLQEQVQHWNISCEVIKKSISEMMSRISEQDGIISKYKTRQQTNEQRIASLTQQIETMQRDRIEKQNEINSLNAKSSQIETQIEPRDQALKEAELKLSDSQTDYYNFQQRSLSAERLLSQAQLDMSRQNDKLDALKKKIEDDFGLVNFSYKSQIAGQQTLPFDGIVAQLPQIDEVNEDLENQIQQLKGQLRRIGAVNPDAVAEYKSVKDRYDFLLNQVADLKKADEDLRKVISELDEMMKKSFQETFVKVQEEFKMMFSRLFGGGSAELVLTQPEDINNSGIEITARLPRHREQDLSLLSGGERSLTSVALIFAMMKVSPTPFCVLDEVDAALDEANVGRFCDLLKELSRETQFLVITHNRNTVETADVIYGITMGHDSTSQLVSLRLDQVNKNYLI